MNHTAQITRDMHTHTRQTRLLMTYVDPASSEKVAKLINNLGSHETGKYLIRTLRWASHNGVEVIFRPV